MKSIQMAFAIALSWFASMGQAGPLTIVENGKSGYSIYWDQKGPQTPKSLGRGVADIQRTLEKATGVKLPIVTAPTSPMICVGANPSAVAAGVDQGLPEFGFRIVTRGQDVFILGLDDADGKEQWGGMPRQGSLLGTYDFLERVVHVRWLLPGELGEDVPKAERIVVPDTDVVEQPGIKYRYYMFIDDTRPEVVEWKLRNRADIKRGGVGLNYSHSFNTYPPNDVLQANPDFMPMKKDGTRAPVPPKGAAHVNYCLSNPKLVQAYADAVIADFDKNPKLFSASVSPDEGAAWCECPDCGKLAMPLPQEWKDLGVNSNPQRTPVVLNFYNQVAKKVAQKYPDRVLGAAIYQDYLVPLEKPIKMEPNLVFGLGVNSGYGFKFYQPRRQQLMQRLFEEWGKYGVPLAYNDYNTWMRNWFGFPLPPGIPLLKWGFPLLKKHHVDFIQFNGQEAWGYGAAHNYLTARLMWNPDANVDDLYNEFLTRAYGPDAAGPIAQMYQLVDEKLQAYIQSKPYPDHEIDYELAKAVYAPIYPEIERLYLDALGKTKTEPQRKRLELLGDNLVMTHFNLRKAKLLSKEEAEKSPLYLNTDDYEEFVAKKSKHVGVLNMPAMLSQYKHDYTEMPILREGWKPK